MINQNKFRDNTNFLKFAGKTNNITDNNVSNSIRQDTNQSNKVNIKIKKGKKSNARNSIQIQQYFT